jgi:fermentation-respiration switch protein FrsA (DUF1100 family)
MTPSSIMRICAVALVLAAMVAMGSARAEPAPSLEGDWDGVITAGPNVAIPIVLHVHGAAATLDSPSQGASGIPTEFSQAGRQIILDVARVQGRFLGTLSDDGARLAGEWSQAGARMPLAFERRKAGLALNDSQPERPQTPKPPFPYRTLDIAFAGGVADVTLAGTLTLPAGDGPFAAVVLIAGSGPNDRDETLFGHKPFWVLADALSRRGLAVLRYDKRGTGKSSGNYAAAVTADFTSDTQAAVNWLRTQPQIRANRIGVLGHSEGGIIAPRVAVADPTIAFVVMMAGPGTPGDRIIMEQVRLNAVGAGTAPDRITAILAMQRRLLSAVEQSSDAAQALTAATAILIESGMPPEMATGRARILASPWYRAFLIDDPAPTLARLRQPLLAIGGSLDTQVPASENLAAIRAAATLSTDVTVRELAGLNHLFQAAKTGAFAEYVTIEETMSPAVLDLLGEWIVVHAH